jgi:hypothetical protein
MAKRKGVQDATIETSTQNASAPDAARAATPRSEQTHSRSHRFALLAGSVGVAATVGAMIGSAGMNVAARLLPAASAQSATIQETHVLKDSIAQLAAELSALKTSVEALSKSASGQFTRITERLERAQNEPAVKLAKIAEGVERLDRRTAAAPETTGSIPTPATPAASAESKDASKPAIVAGWIVRDVHRGRALLENRYAVYEVETGANIPGLGRVETIKRQDGHWVVVTQKGLITSYR